MLYEVNGRFTKNRATFVPSSTNNKDEITYMSVIDNLTSMKDAICLDQTTSISCPKINARLGFTADACPSLCVQAHPAALST